MDKNIDKLLISGILALGAISISIIFAANRSLALSQLVFWIFGLSVLYFASHFYYQTWQKFSLPFYLISLILLVLVLLFADPIRGSIRWIDLGVFRLQPSEIAKISTILLLSTFFTKKSAKELKNVFISFVLIAPIFALIFIQPDIGSAAAILAIWLGITFAAGMQKKDIVLLAGLGLLVAFLSFEFLAPYQKGRIATFLSPSKDPLGSGYNIIQSKIAVGSGQIFGRGLGQGSQSALNFLPEAQSDFIFASIAEQLGFLGAFFTIILSSWILLRISNLLAVTNRFGQLVIIGSIFVLSYQFVINVGMNMGILPVTGITLPFVSYGGSSLISLLFLLGIVFSLKTRKYEE